MKQLTDSFSTWFVQRQLSPDNAEKLASIFGTYVAQKNTHMTENGVVANKGSTREVYEYVCHPNNIKAIGIGKAILLTMNPTDVHLINIRLAGQVKLVEEKKSYKKEAVNHQTLGGES